MIHRYIDIIDKFIESQYFKDFTIKVLESIYIYLRDHGHIPYTFNYYQYEEIVYIYFKCLFKSELTNVSIENTDLENTIIFDNSLFSDITNKVKYIFKSAFKIPNALFEYQKGRDDYLIDLLYSTSIQMYYTKIFNFCEHFVSSALTKDIIYKLLNYFIKWR